MDAGKGYTLPHLPYGYKALAPYISEVQLTLHHQKHHQAYVTGANAILEKLEKARKENADLDMKALLKELSFHVGGFRLHNMFWENLAPSGVGGGGIPKGALAAAINAEFGTLQCRGIRMGCADVLHEHRAAHDDAGRKAQCQPYPGIPDPDGPRSLGARLLSGLQK